MWAPPVQGNFESEHLERYCPGGFHPVDIGDTFCAGRYRVLQKLGWGGFSTVWLVHDSLVSRLAALKVVVSKIGETSNEVRILQRIASIPAEHEGYHHLRQLTNYFLHDGPNGRHQCLVFEVGGVSVPNLVVDCPSDRTTPGRLAWQISKQITVALDCLHSNGIAHGDLYTGNVLVSQSKGHFSDPDSFKHLEPPVLGDITATPDYQFTKNLPRHVVHPAEFPILDVRGRVHATIIDFEQSFLQTDQSLKKIYTPQAFRAPETLLDSKWDLRMDIWSLACTMFELVTGQPPFDCFMPSEDSLVLEWIAMFGDVPEEWRNRAKVVVGDSKADFDKRSISAQLHAYYFGSEETSYCVQKGKPEFSTEDLELMGDLLSKMMRYRPEERLSTQEILKHEWFAKNPLGGDDAE